MPQLTPQQETKLKRLHRALSGGAVGVLSDIEELEDALTQKIISVERQLPALRSAKDGKDGLPGKDGLDGKDGKDGKDGAPGKDGKDGAPGKNGLPGKDGRDGIDGQDGKDGKDGFVDEATIGYLENKMDTLARTTAKINSKMSDGIGVVVRGLTAGNNIEIGGTIEYPTISTTPQITVSASQPSNPSVNDIWLDIS